MKLNPKKELLNMDLHSKLRFDDLTVYRVIGGWVYLIRRQGETSMAATFVPEEKP